MSSVKIIRGKKELSISAKEVGLFSTGLMFKSINTDNLLFDMKRDPRYAITSLFVFFPFLAIWLDNRNNVLDFQIVKPFTFRIVPNKSFRKLIEIPVNSKNSKIIAFFDEERRKV